MTDAEPGVWVFNGENGRFPAGVFSTVELAERWIGDHGLSGVLTWYPLDVSVYEWVQAKGFWEPTREQQRTPEFVQKFSSAYTGHVHYENGRRDG